MRQEKPKKIYQAQQGFAMIIVVSILTVILALIAIGFSKLSNRELRQAANRESSAQAYYAAQSGINDAKEYIKAGGTTFTHCNDWPHSGSPNGDNYFTTDLSVGSNIARYSCITVDNTPQVLYNPKVSPGQPWIVKVDADKLQNLFIGWENYRYDFSNPANPLAFLSSTPATFGTLPQESTITNPNTTGVLRVGLYEVPHSGTSDNDTLAHNSRSYYLYPDSGGGSAGTIAFDAGSYCVDKTLHCPSNTSGPGGNNGNFVKGDCKNSLNNDPSGNGLGYYTYCNSKITHLDGHNNYYYLYFTALYSPLKVVIQGTPHGQVKFTSAQAVVDVTGQGVDQIQRVRATVGLTPQFNAPNYAVQSMETLCKGFVLQILSSTTYQISDGPGATGYDPTDCRVTAGPSDNIQGGGMVGH